ncbi:MAG: ABC transporter permease subunit, partial [Nocardioides sp.]|nr:ABC transporter permease subunit [Nocardioides sp.]
VFAALALAVAASGYVLTGGLGVQDVARTAVSLVQLVVLLVPLTSLLIGVSSLAPEREAEILFSQPVARWAVLLGRMLGLFVALAAAQGLGLGAAGIVIFSQSGPEGLAGYLALGLGALALTAIFLGVAALIAVRGLGCQSGRPLAVALVTWFAAVVLFDLVALGVASLLPSGPASRLLIALVILNPVDAVRTGALLAIEGVAAFGAASLAFLRFTGGPARGAALLAACLSGLAALVAALTIRRGLAVAAVIVVLLVSYTVVATIQGIAYEAGNRTVGEVAGLFSPYTLVNGVQVFLFDSPEATPTPPTGDGMGLVYVLAVLATVLGAIGGLLARYRTVHP